MVWASLRDSVLLILPRRKMCESLQNDQSSGHLLNEEALTATSLTSASVLRWPMDQETPGMDLACTTGPLEPGTTVASLL
jgi:hypothetical protein